MSRRRRTAHLDRWRRSLAFREIARNTLRRINAERQKAPKCGADARSTGEPCRQPAMENGRCYYHGGRTPKGEGWHKPLFPRRDSKAAPARLNRKLQDLDKRRKKRAKRIAQMAPEQQEQHAAWQKSHKPGPAGPRATERARRTQNKATKNLLAAAEKRPPATAEGQELVKAIDELKRRLEGLRQAAAVDPETYDTGVFS
jgi:hypothetical protein